MSQSVLNIMRQWVETSIPELREVIYHRPVDQRPPPRPREPYAAIRLLHDSPMGASPHVATTDTEEPADVAAGIPVDERRFVQKRSHKRTGTLRIDIFADQAMDYGRELRSSLWRDEIYTLLRSGLDALGQPLRIGLSELGQVTDTTLLRSTAWEPSAQVDFRVTWVHRDWSPVYAIETVQTPLQET